VPTPGFGKKRSPVTLSAVRHEQTLPHTVRQASRKLADPGQRSRWQGPCSQFRKFIRAPEDIMTAAANIASFLAPAAPTAGRNLVSSAEAGADNSFETFLQQAQAVPADNSKTTPLAGDGIAATHPATTAQEPLGLTPSAVPAAEQAQVALTIQQATESQSLADGAGAELTSELPTDAAILAMLAALPQQQPASVPSLEPGSDAGVTTMPVTTTAAVQAQALAANTAQDPSATQAQSVDPQGEANTASMAATPASTAIDAADLANLAALANQTPRQGVTQADKPGTQATTPDAQAPSLSPDQITAARPDTQTAVQGPGNGTSKDPQQAISAANTDPQPRNDAQSTQTATPAQSGPSSFAVELRQVTAQPQAAAPNLPVPVDALAVNIARKFEQGLNQFEISLTPGDLGKLDISLKIADDGRVQAVLRAERQDTLDLLRQDARTLENQLRQAGLDVGSNALSFQLSQGNAHRYKSALSGQAYGPTNESTELPAEPVGARFIASRRPDGVDIHV
jgi:chemotaxis protein MotD